MVGSELFQALDFSIESNHDKGAFGRTGSGTGLICARGKWRSSQPSGLRLGALACCQPILASSP
jgi:hypothetical protein